MNIAQSVYTERSKHQIFHLLQHGGSEEMNLELKPCSPVSQIWKRKKLSIQENGPQRKQNRFTQQYPSSSSSTLQRKHETSIRCNKGKANGLHIEMISSLLQKKST